MESEIFASTKSGVLSLPVIHTKAGTILAGFTTRLGGFSSSPYATFNFGYHVGDSADSVTQNRRQLGEIIGISPENWVGAEQVHGNQVAYVSRSDVGRGALDYPSALSGIDGLLTDQTECLLTACFADCTPLFFWSEEAPAVGIAHAGWKGTVGEIASVMTEKFLKQFNIMPASLSVAIGPSIGPCCYEVDDVVANRVKAISGMDADDVLNLKDNGHYMLNLQLLNKQILLKNGLSAENIFTTTLCTSCRTDLFFSHRKEGGPTGRMMGYIGILSGD
ncbi:MAG: peptidoglycan editing factor PgeF [Tuberibacillus sp.]